MLIRIFCYFNWGEHDAGHTAELGRGKARVVTERNGTKQVGGMKLLRKQIH
jgi:hypothetical protein